jgi:hypothetical protein
MEVYFGWKLAAAALGTYCMISESACRTIVFGSDAIEEPHLCVPSVKSTPHHVNISLIMVLGNI